MVPRDPTASPRALGSTRTRTPASRKIFEFPSAPIGNIVIFFDAHIFHLQILGRCPGNLARVSRQRRYLELWTLTIPDLICAWLEQASFAAVAKYLAQRFADLAYSIFVYASSIPTILFYWMISSRHTKLHRRKVSLNWTYTSHNSLKSFHSASCHYRTRNQE